MDRDSIKPTGDATRSSLGIKVPQDAPVGELFRVQPPSGVVTVTLYGEHYGDNDFTVIWKGRVTSVEWVQPWLILHTENIFSSLQRIGLRRKIAAQCPLALYGCGVLKEDFVVNMTVSSITGAVVVCTPSSATDYFAGGYASWTHATRGTIERRMIRSSTGGTLTFAVVPPGLVPGMVIKAYPGCDHTLATCNSKFNNSLNFGGMPFIPSKNAFNGSSVF